MLCRYRPHKGEHGKVGWVPPILSTHDQPIVSGRMIPIPNPDGGTMSIPEGDADAKPPSEEMLLFEARKVTGEKRIARVFTAHHMFEVDEHEEPHLAAFVCQDRRFTVTNRRTSGSTKAGPGIG